MKKKITDPDVKAGDTVDAMGVPIQVYSDDEMEKSVNEENLTVMCMPVDMGGTQVSGSTVGRCGGCGRDVWVSPSTRDSVPVGAILRCVFCVKDEVEANGEPSKIVSTEQQTREIREELEETEDPWGEL